MEYHGASKPIMSKLVLIVREAYRFCRGIQPCCRRQPASNQLPNTTQQLHQQVCHPHPKTLKVMRAAEKATRTIKARDDGICNLS